MRALVTGTAGFIGNHLARELLTEGHDVAGVDSMTPYYDLQLKRDRLATLDGFKKYKNFEITLEDMDALSAAFEAFQPEVIVHLAAQAGVRYSLEHPRAYVDSNVVGSFNITELAKQHNVKHLVMASTSSAYGANKKIPFAETDQSRHPRTIYAATKLASELIAHSHSHLYNIPTTMLRFFTVYGPWGRPDMAPYLFTDRVLKGETIDVYNHGKMRRDFTYIDDLSRAIRLLMDTPPVKGQSVADNDSLSPEAPHRIVNIGNAQPVQLMDFIKEIEAATGKKAVMNFMDMQPGDVTQTYADSSLLKILTGYQPSTSVSDGVAQFVDWFKGYHGA